MFARNPYGCCPLCNGVSVMSTLKADCSKHPLYKPEISPEITWLRCANCEHIYTDGFHTEEALDVIFSDTNQNQKVGADFENQRYVSAKIIEKVLPFADDGYWCDIGFGNGSLLFTAAEYGFSPVGIDLRKDNVEAMVSLGIEAHRVELTSFSCPSKFTVVSMCDVLEHMPYPIENLEAVHSLLKPDGVLFLSMPNADSMAWQFLHSLDRNPYWGELEHYHNFGRKRLYQLLRDCGFEPIRYGISERYRVCMEIIAKRLD
jgi:SAM-dependent methyltransferase